MPKAVRVTAFDHVVINVADPETSLRFYCEDLGLDPVRVDEWHKKDAPFPSVRVNDSTIIDLLPLHRSGENCDHFCLVVEPTDFEDVKQSGRFEVADGPARRYGARGDGTSLYIRDPDRNLVELRYYDDDAGEA